MLISRCKLKADSIFALDGKFEISENSLTFHNKSRGFQWVCIYLGPLYLIFVLLFLLTALTVLNIPTRTFELVSQVLLAVVVIFIFLRFFKKIVPGRLFPKETIWSYSKLRTLDMDRMSIKLVEPYAIIVFNKDDFGKVSESLMKLKKKQLYL